MTDYTYKQLQEMSTVQLTRLAGQLRHEIQRLAFSAGLNELKQVHTISKTRQTLARVMTLLNRPEAAKTDGQAKQA